MNKNKDITPYNDKGQSHGYWKMYYDGTLYYKCYYVNGKESGYEELYTIDNDLELRFHL